MNLCNHHSQLAHSHHIAEPFLALCHVVFNFIANLSSQFDFVCVLEVPVHYPSQYLVSVCLDIICALDYSVFIYYF